MLHAGVLMKLGHFSIIRVAFEILPETTRELMPIAAVLCIFSIIYGGLVAYYAKDTKYVIGYSSSSHMGYVFLGMAALDYISLSGAVIYMFAHAMATGMLFAMAGWVYDQTHTRDIPSLGGLSNRMPFISAAFVIGCMASIGMPGTVNFIAEVMIIVGSWNTIPLPGRRCRPRYRADHGLSLQDDAGLVLWLHGREIQPLTRCRDRR
jgi:NADH-quinone oxidoreductase subunit M